MEEVFHTDWTHPSNVSPRPGLALLQRRR